MISDPHWRKMIKQIVTEVERDYSKIADIKAKVKSENTSKYIIQDGIFYCLSERNEKLVVPEVLRSDILEANHENMGHRGWIRLTI